MINVVNNKRTSQKIRCKTVVFRIDCNKCIRRSDHSRLFQRFRSADSITRTNTCKRKKCCTSKLILLKELNHPLSSIFITGNNILDTSAKCSLNRNLILLFYFDEICNNTEKSRFLVLVVHDTPNAVSISIITLCNIFQRLQSGLLPVIRSLADTELFRQPVHLCLNTFNLFFICILLLIKFNDLCGNIF